MVTRRFLLLAALSGFFVVMLGAFGAHIMRRMLPDDDFQVFETGVRYQFYHTIALLAVALFARYLTKGWIEIAGWLFVLGIVFFSGSLYVLSVEETLGLENGSTIFGPMTPIGGIFLMGGWLSLFRAGFDYKKGGGRRSSSEEK